MTSLEKDTFIAVAKEGDYNLGNCGDRWFRPAYDQRDVSTIVSCNRQGGSAWRNPTTDIAAPA